jgi:5-methylcytosine-specific restriction endonuclease McrA
MDHIKPRSKYPHLALDINNLQPACADYNTGKGNWDSTDWR